MFKLTKTILKISLIAFFINPNTSLANELCDNALLFTNELTDNTIEILNSNELTNNQKKTQISDLLTINVDFTTMGKIMLGKYARKINEEQELLYYEIIEKMVSKTIYDRLETNEDSDVVYTISNDTCREKGSKGKEFLIDGDVMKNDSRLASIRWWLILNKDNEYKVVDLTLAGLSLTLQKKEEFTSYLSNKSIDMLITDLSRKFN
ncbi:MAG: ABC transporter substrate-binding protein [Hyphomicrobiales bacterium]